MVLQVVGDQVRGEKWFIDGVQGNDIEIDGRHLFNTTVMSPFVPLSCSKCFRRKNTLPETPAVHIEEPTRDSAQPGGSDLLAPGFAVLELSWLRPLKVTL